jgi:uncharacterized protein (DUF2252 family)
MDPSERAAAGRAARSASRRSAHGDWQPADGREDPVAILERQAETRVQELVPIRYGRMAASPFAFFRGAAAVMAADLSETPDSGLRVQACGDAHLSNFGAYAAPDRRLIFSVNDLDETLPGPFEWDVKRLVVSFAVAGRDRGFSDAERAAANLEVGRSYRTAMRDFAAMRTLDVWYARLDVDDIAPMFAAQASSKAVKRFEKNVAKARSKDSIRALDRLTHQVDGRLRIISDAPLIVPVEELFDDAEFAAFEHTVRNAIRAYRRTLAGDRRHLLERYHYVDSARKVVGVGSVGTRCWIVLMIGADDQDPLMLQIKEAEKSVLEPFAGKSEFDNCGRRVVEGQRLMQSASDIMLGWFRTSGFDGNDHDYYIRQLWDGKGAAIVEAMDPTALSQYAAICGWTLARAHARSGDAVAIASYLGSSDTFDRAMASYAEAYADQNERDYAAFQAAVASGRLQSVSGL